VLKSSAGKPSIQILCAAEVDCVLADTDEFVEIKTQLKHLGLGWNFASKGAFLDFKLSVKPDMDVGPDRTGPAEKNRTKNGPDRG
jgi:hypothetical protein